MRLHRIYTEKLLEPGLTVSVSDAASHYLVRVLRVSVAQPIVLFNGDGSDYAAEVTSLARKSIEILVRSRLPSRAESPLHITLVQAISRGERMDISLQKATELGVAAFQPVFSARTEVRLTADKLEKRLEHWKKVIVSACEQSGRSRLPAVHPPLDVMEWAVSPSSALRLVLAPDVPATLASVPLDSRVELVVGPEGGFEANEVSGLASCDVLPVSLGPRILRTETAGPAAIAVMQALRGDLA